MKTFTSLSEIREEIDRIDEELLTLITQRAQCSLQVADIKNAEKAPGDTTEILYYRPEREAQILRKMQSLNQGPLDNETVARFYREIISASLALEQPLQVAYLGPEGTFTHAAALKHFGSSIQGKPCDDIGEIFKSVQTGATRFGVVPVENSTQGMISHTLDLLTDTTLNVCGECRLRIEHNLLSNADSLQNIRSVHAHPQALAQCRHWLDANLPHATRENSASNASAAESVQSDTTAAAIASLTAAELYKLAVLEKNIEDLTTNTTRFFIIGTIDVPPSGKDATSLLTSVPHRPGGLRQLLKAFEDAGVSMTRIESRPSRSSMWEYNFFIDIDGHKNDPGLAEVLDDMARETHFFRVLGSYPSAI
ncbi:MAG: prephenate dehydratase [Gammaproteobacteria bacterium]|nr:prephenate dehydratase [Gammaproteobacteria bacterium]